MGDAHVGLQARLMCQALRKLAGTLNRTETICLFTNQLREKIGVMFGNPETTPGGRALKFYSSVRLDIRRIETLKEGVEAIGNRVRVKVVKNKVAPPFKQAEFDIMYGEGISWEGTVLDAGVERKIVAKSGSYFSFGDERLGQGRQNATAFLKEHPDVVQAILHQIQTLAAGPDRFGTASPACRLDPRRTVEAVRDGGRDPARRSRATCLSRSTRSGSPRRALRHRRPARRARARRAPSLARALDARHAASGRPRRPLRRRVGVRRRERAAADDGGRADARLAARAYGDEAIRVDLERRGFDADAIEAALAALQPEAERARAAVERAARRRASRAALPRRGSRGRRSRACPSRHCRGDAEAYDAGASTSSFCLHCDAFSESTQTFSKPLTPSSIHLTRPSTAPEPPRES